MIISNPAYTPYSNSQVAASARAPQIKATTLPIASTRFGSEAVRPASTAGTEKFSWIKLLKDFWGHMQHAKNREILKGLGYKYGPDLSLPILFMVPVLGWIAAVVMIPVAWFSKKRGEEILKKAHQHLDPSQPNPISQIAKIEHLWNKKPEHGMAHRLMDEFNILTHTLFPDEDCPKAKSLRDRLTLTQDKKGFQWLSSMVDARIQYSNMLVSKVCKPLSWCASHMPLKSLGLLFSLPELTIQGTLLMKNQRNKAMAQAL